MPNSTQNSIPQLSALQEPSTTTDTITSQSASPDSFTPEANSEQSLEPETNTREPSAKTTNNENEADSLQSSSPWPALPPGNKCSRCRHYKEDAKFLGRTRSYRTCSDCRFAQTVPKAPPPPQEMIQQLSALEFPASAVAETKAATQPKVDGNDNENNTSTPSKRIRSKQDATVTFNLFMNDDLTTQTDEQIVEAILEIVKQRSGYRYSVQNLTKPVLSSTVNFYGKCVQRSDLRRPLLAEERKRQTKVLPTYNCKGKIAGSIHRDQRWIRLSLTHLCHHPPTHPTRKLMPEGAKLYIKGLAESDQSNADLYKRVVSIFGNDITRAQVYFWRREARNNR